MQECNSVLRHNQSLVFHLPKFCCFHLGSLDFKSMLLYRYCFILSSFLRLFLSQRLHTNLLFIIFDDLRPELSPYGSRHMLAPNFERLANQSVIFDHAYCQIAVCNPSRDSLLTGLRPDTTGTYNFEWSFKKHLIFPARLVMSGYKTAGFGKVLHWDLNDRKIWSYEHWDGNWYDYQEQETKFQNSSTMPDKIKPEEEFRDYLFTTKAINAMRSLHKMNSYFALGIGFKLPHLAVHIPYKYFNQCRDRQDLWKLSKRELHFPTTIPAISYKCCAANEFRYMSEEGAKKYEKSIGLGNISFVVPDDMRNELMWGYCGAVSFLDQQIGRLLDVVDELSLWNNLTIILTSDHGIHNGEKGLW